MQPNSNRGTDMSGSSPQLPLHDLQSSDHSPHDDFLDQMLSTFPSWPDLSSNPSFDDSALLASRLRHHQISSKSMGLHINPQHNQLLVSSGLAPLPLSLVNTDSSSEGVNGLYNGLAGSLQAFAHPQGGGTQSFGAPVAGMCQTQSASAATAGGTAPPRQRVRARRGQATDPHSIAERLRRERIAERMKSLQELVPNANKTDKASMLDEIIDYVKFLQLQVKVLSMSRLGGAAAVAPRVGDLSSEGSGARGNGAAGSGGNDGLTVTEHQVAKLMEEDMGSAMQYLQGKGLCLMPISLASAISTATGHPRTLTATPNNNSGALMHHQHSHVAHSNNVDGSTSPNMSVLTVQSAALANTDNDASRAAKDSTSISKP